MTLAQKIKDLFGKEYDEMDPELLDMNIRETKASSICSEFDDSWKVDPLRNVFARETVGVMIYQTIDNIINITFDEEVFDTIAELKKQSDQFKA